MSSKLEQALSRLDTVVEALEKAPPPTLPSSDANPSNADLINAGPTEDSALKEEINAIRSLVDEAMMLLGQENGQPADGNAS